MNIRKADGFALIDILFVCAMIGVLSTIALPRMLLARQSAGAASAIGSLRTIHSAELTFALTCGAGFYSPNLTTLGQAPVGSREAFISPNLATSNSVTRSGYVIEVDGTAFPRRAGQLQRSCRRRSGARDGGLLPTLPVAENRRYFGTNVNGSIWEHSATLSAALPEVGEPPIGHLLR